MQCRLDMEAFVLVIPVQRKAVAIKKRVVTYKNQIDYEKSRVF